jgi:hypothetical protein
MKRHWWAMSDLNARPSRCKRDALTTELTARNMLAEGDGSVNRAANPYSAIFAHRLALVNSIESQMAQNRSFRSLDVLVPAK